MRRYASGRVVRKGTCRTRQAAPGSGAELHGCCLTNVSTTLVLSPPHSWRWPIWLLTWPVDGSTSADQCDRAYFLPAGKAPRLVSHGTTRNLFADSFMALIFVASASKLAACDFSTEGSYQRIV